MTSVSRTWPADVQPVPFCTLRTSVRRGGNASSLPHTCRTAELWVSPSAHNHRAVVVISRRPKAAAVSSDAVANGLAVERSFTYRDDSSGCCKHCAPHLYDYVANFDGVDGLYGHVEDSTTNVITCQLQKEEES